MDQIRHRICEYMDLVTHNQLKKVILLIIKPAAPSHPTPEADSIP